MDIWLRKMKILLTCWYGHRPRSIRKRLEAFDDQDLVHDSGLTKPTVSSLLGFLKIKKLSVKSVSTI